MESFEELLAAAPRDVSEIASFAGFGGFSLAANVWLQLEKTNMERLNAATIMLATLEAPRADLTDLSGLRCGVAQAIGMETAGSVAGGLVGEVGERAVTLVGIADGIAGLARGGRLLLLAGRRGPPIRID